ncbi:TetR/AcrR family transcriptional regulator [Amycolatopsis pigmentata]|uniref:TetR/AcrR family transcriptional regulator n=1 Tax=Amycolatopsis pigmentata TaxID=450801 RepID=A0ABW5FKS6_9PSEU
MAEAWTAKGAATRSRIIDAAAALIYERGLASVGINDVRAATSTSHGQVFHYFPDGRTELLRAVVERQTRRALDDQRPELDALDSWESWQAWRSRLLAVYSARGAVGGCPLGSLAAQMAESDPEAARLISAGFDTWLAHFERGLETMRRDGNLTATTDVPALARSILALVQGGFVLMQASRSVEKLSQALDTALLLLENAGAAG